LSGEIALLLAVDRAPDGDTAHIDGLLHHPSEKLARVRLRLRGPNGAKEEFLSPASAYDPPQMAKPILKPTRSESV
jgi:hypothetical protein